MLSYTVVKKEFKHSELGQRHFQKILFLRLLIVCLEKYFELVHLQVWLETNITNIRLIIKH